MLENLNPEQKLAVETTAGPLLVLSGAGTGKTRVLTTRVAYILNNALALPWQVLALTFTNKAANEMKARLATFSDGASWYASDVWCGTFHSICLRILRANADAAGLRRDFIIYGEDEQKRILKNVFAEMGLDIKDFSPSDWVERISSIKDKGLHSTEHTSDTALKILNAYNAELARLGAVDFGDIILRVLQLFDAFPDILARYQRQFKYILVDEFQDTNAAQMQFLQMLTRGIENPNIYPASALTALNIRTILANSDDDNDDDVYEAKGKVRKFNRNEEMHFEKYAPLTPSMRGEVEDMLAKAVAEGDDNQQALIHAGIVPIEAAIRMYVQKYAKTAKIKNIVDTFIKKLESTQSFEKTKQEIATNRDEQKEILAQIDVIKKKLASGEDAKKFKTQIEQINYDKEISKLAQSVIVAAQKKITKQLSSTDAKLSKRDAESICQVFAKFAEGLQAEVQVKLENLISNHVKKNAEDLLEQYKKKIAELAQDVKVGSVELNPFELMQGDIISDTSALISKMTKSERVKVGEEWIENEDRKWYKPWTWFQEKGHYKEIYEDKEYVDGTELAQKFFAPIQELLYENSESAVEYAKKQTALIKKEFAKKFDELDAVLQSKLKELEVCAKDNENIEARIKETQERLDWLEKIQNKVNGILEI